MDINCKQPTAQDNCYDYTIKCRWDKSKGWVKRDNENDGSEYKNPFFQPVTVEEYIKVAELPPEQLINEVRFIDNSNDLFKNIDDIGNINQFNIFITGLNYTEYTKSNNKLFHFFYRNLMNLLAHFLKSKKDSISIFSIVYVRFLQFMELSTHLKSCYEIEDIEIINADLETAKIITPITTFDKILKQCKNTKTNILIPVGIKFSSPPGHKNTLVVETNENNQILVYLIEPNGIKHKYITKLFEKYFEETNYIFMGFYKYQLNYCHHGGFCNLFAILLYFLKPDKIYEYYELKEYIVKYFMWEYNNLCKKLYIEIDNSFYYILEYIKAYLLKRKIDKEYTLQEKREELHDIYFSGDRGIRAFSGPIVINNELKKIISEFAPNLMKFYINTDYHILNSLNKIENLTTSSSFGKKQKNKLNNSLKGVDKDIFYLKR